MPQWSNTICRRGECMNGTPLDVGPAPVIGRQLVKEGTSAKIFLTP